MHISTLTFNILYMIYFIGMIITAHTLNKTTRKMIDCIITWIVICLLMILFSTLFMSIDKKIFPSLNMWDDLFLLTNLIPLLAYLHLFSNNSITYNIFSYFTIASIYTIMLIAARTIASCLVTLFGWSSNILTIILFVLLVGCYLYYDFKKLRYIIPKTMDHFQGTLFNLAVFSLVTFFGIHFLVDVWGEWKTMDYHLFLKDVSIIVMPLCAFIFLFSSLKNLLEKEKYERATYYDELTGIGNRRKLTVDLLNIDIANTQEHYYLVYMDLDFFKSINDHYGHEVGDRYLINYVNLIKSYFHEERIYRMSGDEFVAILKDQPQQSQKIKEDLELLFKKGFSDKIIPHFLGASIGVVEIHERDYFQQYIKEADYQMYKNKKDHHKVYNT